jgi:hypothetical protein
MGEKITTTETAEERVRDTAARLRNILDQKNGREKQVLKRYLVELERRVLRSKVGK